MADNPYLTEGVHTEEELVDKVMRKSAVLGLAAVMLAGCGANSRTMATTPTTQTQGYAAQSGIRYAEALMKNRYVHRTFIMPTQEARELNVRLKLNPMRHVLEGQRVVLMDDSIVRGTTMKRIVQMVRDAGAKEVHVRIGCPPIVAPCYLGIDMNTRDQLVAAHKSIKDIETMIGADSLAYISEKGLYSALGFKEEELCTGCITGRYPVAVSGERLRDGSKVPGTPPVPECC